MKVRNPVRTAVLAAITVAATGAAMTGVASPAGASDSPKFTTVLSGLGAPRGIAFDGQGNMYVSESGVAGTGAAGMTHTGKVTKYRRGTTTPVWSTSLNSLFVTLDPTQPPDILGPEGLSALANSCTKRDDRGSKCQISLITSESTPGILAATQGAVNDPQAGRLFRLNGRTGAATAAADVGSQMYAFTGANTNLFPSDFPDSNPYGVLVAKDHDGKVHTYVADAGANTISEVMPNGKTRIIAYIPNETAAPFRDATPTCIAQGPDGFLYVGTLHFVANLFVFGSGQSDVWRVNPNANFPTAPKLWASGFTTITSCMFDNDGHFWATEMFQPQGASAPPGDIAQMSFRHPGTIHRIGGPGQLPLPGGIAQGPNGALYVTTGSSAPGMRGGVVKVRVDD